MSKVLVDRELLELLQERLDPHRDAVLWGNVYDALRRAQPAEAEGVGKWSELKKLAEKATPGPWWVDSHGHRVSTEDGMQTVFIAADKMGPATRHPETGNLSHWPNDWDASYIVNASPDKILELIAALSAVTAERDAANSRLHEVAVACATAEQERDQLRAKLEALRKDAERLDRLDIECEAYGCEDIHEGNRWMIDGPFRTVRDAIDAAMAAKEA